MRLLFVKCKNCHSFIFALSHPISMDDGFSSFVVGFFSLTDDKKRIIWCVLDACTV